MYSPDHLHVTRPRLLVPHLLHSTTQQQRHAKGNQESKWPENRPKASQRVSPQNRAERYCAVSRPRRVFPAAGAGTSAAGTPDEPAPMSLFCFFFNGDFAPSTGDEANGAGDLLCPRGDRRRLDWEPPSPGEEPDVEPAADGLVKLSSRPSSSSLPDRFSGS